MHGAIRCDHRIKRPGQSNQHRKAQIRPPAIIPKLGKNHLSWGSRSRDPQSDNDGKEANEMQNQHEDLDLRELLGEEDVQTDRHCRYSDDE